MFESGYYPPGAEFDPNAPYNQPPDITEVYHEEAVDEINDEIAVFYETFEEFLVELCDVPDENNADVKGWYESLTSEEQESINDRYFDFRFDEVCQQIAERNCPDYD